MTEGEARGRARPFVWAALFIAAMGGTATASIFGFLDSGTRFFLILISLGLLIPMTRAARRREEQKGRMSPALHRYNTRVLVCGALYMIAMIAAGNLHDRIEPGSPTMWLAALAPTVPALGMIWTMRRYLAEEDDEFLRHRAVSAALFGLGLVLVVGTVWGFLETFGLAPHVWAWWVFPVWAIGLGIAHCRSGARA